MKWRIWVLAVLAAALAVGLLTWSGTRNRETRPELGLGTPSSNSGETTQGEGANSSGTISNSRSAAGSSTTIKKLPERATTSISVPKAPARMRTVALSALPIEAQKTWRLIDRGGPYPYERDGVTFENREQRLPKAASGYYKEYTVPTPGESDRGARRLIVGAKRDVYYTDDHYDSFGFVEVEK